MIHACIEISRLYSKSGTLDAFQAACSDFDVAAPERKTYTNAMWVARFLFSKGINPTRFYEIFSAVYNRREREKNELSNGVVDEGLR